MKRFLIAFAVMGLVAPTGVAMAVDADNNGIQGDEGVHEPGSYDGALSVGGDTVIFPSLPADTWDVMFYPYWWNAGDTAYGMHDVDLSPVDHAECHVELTYNSLTAGCGFVDVDFMIDGDVVGSFQFLPGVMTYDVVFDFDPKVPPFELRYLVTNTVAGGCGSVSLNESGANTVYFTGDSSTPTQNKSWAAIKALY